MSQSKQKQPAASRKHGYRSFVDLRGLIIALVVLLTACYIILAVIKPVALFGAVVVIVVDTLAVLLLIRYRTEQRLALYRLADELGSVKQSELYYFPIPVLVCSRDGKIVWYNDVFHDRVCNREEMAGKPFSMISSEPLDDFCNRTGVQISHNEKYYHVYGTYSETSELYLLYFEENTNLISIAQEYQMSRPSVILLMVDNYDDVFEGKRDSVRSTMLGLIDAVLEKFVGDTTGFLQRVAKDKFLIVMEQRHLDKILEGKFSILDQVREIGSSDHTPITLSIGVGACAQTLGESEQFARQALDMALGRGGDQVAVKTSTGFDFYGGVSKGVEKRTRVKSRVIATALRELIDQSDKVILMGHRFSDLDCAGAAIGLSRAIQKLGKPSYIAIDSQKTLAKLLLTRLQESGLGDMLLFPQEAESMVTGRTLLIVVDTHNPEFVESTNLYKKCKNVVVIDHHRKMVKYIDNAMIFYHEPYASSASELVTELIQYLGDCKLGAMEAEALLSGIMLDTKNFVLRVGVRTFEAAAYLKSLGADTVSVRKLFSSTIDSYQRKTRIVAGAETYRNCAIALGDFQSDDMRVIAPQAADELLSISDVDASFVIYMTDTTANISARSLGAINAQVVMEKLGGGGHQTQAACQLEDTNAEKARQMLLEAIDEVLGASPNG